MTISPSVNTWFSLDADVSQSAFKLWAQQVEADMVAAALSAVMHNNLIINGNAAVWQTSTGSIYPTTTADDTYGGPDRYYSLTEAGLVTPIQQAISNGVHNFVHRTTQSHGSAQRFGRAQIVESVIANKYRQRPLIFMGNCRNSAASSTMVAVLQWSGTSDAVVSDVVLNWASTGYTINDFFINNANLSVLGVTEVTHSATNSQDFFALSVTPTSTCNNLIVFTWTKSQQANGVFIEFTHKLVPGDNSDLTTFGSWRHFPIELFLCQRYREVRGDLTPDRSIMRAVHGTSSGTQFMNFTFFGTKRAQPTVTINNTTYSNASGAAAFNPYKSGFELGLTITGSGGFVLFGFDANCEL